MILVITGGASGIGAAISKLFLSEEVYVIIADLQETRDQSLLDKISGGVADGSRFIRTNVTCEAEVQAAMELAASSGETGYCRSLYRRLWARQCIEPRFRSEQQIESEMPERILERKTQKEKPVVPPLFSRKYNGNREKRKTLEGGQKVFFNPLTKAQG